jgi:hypothetical protein
MKVFISHSSRDKWAARRISTDLNNLGIETFLDEKDIKTGESINDKIQDNLSDSDDLLILISPASVDSQWVLIELGGAIALKKNIIPILLYVGANDIPKPISKLLGRDINEIDKYYEEIKAKISGKKQLKTKDKKLIKSIEDIQIGDKVRLPLKRQESEFPGWDNQMDKYLGLEAEITQLVVEQGIEMAKVNIDKSEWYWSINWLVKIE